MDLARLIDELSRESTTWLFRGEPATTYELRPSAGREGDDASARTLEYNPEQERVALRRLRLDFCAINYASLFPDLQGLARHVGWRYKWGLSQPPPGPLIRTTCRGKE